MMPKSLSWLLLIFMPAIIVFVHIAVLTRLICAFLYNLTDIVQYPKWMFQETKNSFHILVLLPSQFVDVIKMLIKD